MMHLLRRSLVLLAAAGLVAAVTPRDLDVAIPEGTPFDSMKIPKDTPTGHRPGDTSTGGGAVKPAPAPAPAPDGQPAGPRATVAEDPKKKPPPAPPMGLPGITAPSTIDYENHLKWNPRDKDVLREFKDNDVATGTPPAGAPVKFEIKDWPPSVPNNLYVYGVTRFLMVMLHPAMVSERELTEYLIEMGYVGRYAATATQGEKRLERMTKTVMEDVGPMTDQPPPKPKDEVSIRVYLDLLTHYPYEASFGSWILTQPSEVTLPVLLNIVKTSKHPELLRNAVFILRCFNNPEIVAPLRTLLMKTQDKVVRNRAVAALVRWQDEDIVDWLCKQLAGPDVPFRSYALWALGRIGAPAATERIIAAVKQFQTDREFLWAAIPALGWIGENALPDRKKKIEDFLLALRPTLPSVPEPTPWDGTGGMAVKTPDPKGVTATILDQRLLLALARTGHQESRDRVKGMTESDFLIPNRENFRETHKKIQGGS